MGGDMVVALGRATANGHALFGQNCNRPAAEGQRLCGTPGRAFAPGEKVHAQYVEIPQARETYAVLAWRPEAWWGYAFGVNEPGVALGCTALRNRLDCPGPGLTGGDLVRLALERARTARQAVDLLTGLVERHGQSAPPDDGATTGADNGFLIADAAEAFALETAGHAWVCQEVQEVRAAGNVCLIRQDWDHIAAGLAGDAIARGWWPADGSKLDFAGTLSADPTGQSSGLRRWGRATLLLEGQNGHVDVPFLRGLLSDHYEGTHFEVDPHAAPGPVPLCRHGHGPGAFATTASAVVQLPAGADRVPVVWLAFGPPCQHVYFPLFLGGDLPRPFTLGRREGEHFNFWHCLDRLDEWPRGDPESGERLRQDLTQLQARFDQEADELAAEGAALQRQGRRAEWQRRAGLFMQHHLEQFEAALEGRRDPGRRAAEQQAEAISYY